MTAPPPGRPLSSNVGPVYGPPPPPKVESAFTETPLNRLAVFSVIAGIITGLLVALLNLAILATEKLVYGSDHLSTLDPGSNVSPLRLGLTLAATGLVTSWAWYSLGRWGQPGVSVPAAMGGTRMPPLSTVFSGLIQVVSVAAGSPVGRENAPRLLGGLAAAGMCDFFSIDMRARRILIAASAGAGLAASFHLPLAGALFALELLLVEMSTRTVISCMVTSATAVATTSIFVPQRGIFHAVILNETPVFLVVAAITGLVAGIAGHLFGIAARRAVSSRATGAQVLWAMPAAFALYGLAAFLFPEAGASARFAADTVFVNELSTLQTLGAPVLTLLVLIAVRSLAVLLCFKTGTVGGTLMPAFSLGAMIGALMGAFLQPLFPGVTIGTFALLGAAAFLSTTMAAPLFGMLAAIEFTDMGAQGYLPMFIAVIFAALAVRLFAVLTSSEQLQLPFTTAAWTLDPKATPGVKAPK